MKIWIPQRNKDKDLGRLDLDEVETALLWSIDGKTDNLELARRTGFAEARIQKALYRLYVEGLISRGDAADDTLISWRPSLPPETPAPQQDAEAQPQAPDGAQEFEACESAPTLEVRRSDVSLAAVHEISDVFTRRQAVPPPADAPGPDESAPQASQDDEDAYDPSKSMPTLELKLGTDGDAEISQLSLVAEPIPADAEVFTTGDNLPAFEAEEARPESTAGAASDEGEDSGEEEEEFGPDASVRTVRVEPADQADDTASADDDEGFGDDDSVRTIQLESADDEEAHVVLVESKAQPVGSPPAAGDWGAGFKASEVQSGGFGSGSVVSTVVMLDDPVESETDEPPVTASDEIRGNLPTLETSVEDRSPFAEPQLDDDEPGAELAPERSAEFPANHELETVQQRGPRVTDTLDDETTLDEG